MLVLTRKKHQSIMVGDNIEISVLDVIGDKVRIGIQAPREVSVFRKEVFLEIRAPVSELPVTSDAPVAPTAGKPEPMS
jgi:carbon storage regulator